MVDPFVGEIRVFGFDFAPRGWAACDGELMPLSQNTVLFSLLGITYGGNGRTNFALPDLRGRAPMMWGQGPGLTERIQGEPGGSASVTLVNSEMPAHDHSVMASNRPSESGSPEDKILGSSVGSRLYSDAAPDTQMDMQALSVTGSSMPHENMQPYQALLYCIATQGVFPPHN